MKFVLSVFLLCAVVTIQGAPQIEQRIVGGADAPDGKYPYMVSLQKKRHICGGSIINKRWIMTAAHCIHGQSQSLKSVFVGTNKSTGDKGKKYKIEYLVYHDKFTTSELTYDIGLVRVKEDIEFNDKVQPIRLPNQNFTKVNYPATLSGWGFLSVHGQTPVNLQEIELKVIDHGKCAEIWRNRSYEIADSQICTLTRSGEGACYGDSGSPLISDGVQIGIASAVDPCAVGMPDVFTRVYSFVDWIHEQMAGYQNKISF